MQKAKAVARLIPLDTHKAIWGSQGDDKRWHTCIASDPIESWSIHDPRNVSMPYWNCFRKPSVSRSFSNLP